MGLGQTLESGNSPHVLMGLYSIILKMSLSEPVDVYTLVCNRPFVYYIEDTFNGDVAFVGCVTYLDDQQSE